MKTSKKIAGVIIGVVVLALIVSAVIWAKNYYQDRYVSSEYYAMIPLNYDVTPEMLYTMDGKDMGPGKEYNLTIYNEKGESKEVSFNVFAPNGGQLASERELPKPGEFLSVKASKQIVNAWSVIDKSAVPEAALKKLMAQ